MLLWFSEQRYGQTDNQAQPSNVASCTQWTCCSGALRRISWSPAGWGNIRPLKQRSCSAWRWHTAFPPQNIVCEDQATSTFASALRCGDILRQRGWSRVLVVTDRYHLPRALFAFRSCGLRAVGSAAPGKPARRLWRRWYYYLREGLACLWYLVRAVPVLLQRRGEAGGSQSTHAGTHDGA